MVKKSKSTKERCGSCKHEKVYPPEFIFPIEDRNSDYFYCGRLQSPLSWWKVLGNRFKPTYLDGTIAVPEMCSKILHWIYNDAEFSPRGKAIGRITVPCPGFEKAQ